MEGFEERSQRALSVKPEELGQDKFAQASTLYLYGWPICSMSSSWHVLMDLFENRNPLSALGRPNYLSKSSWNPSCRRVVSCEALWKICRKTTVRMRHPSRSLPRDTSSQHASLPVVATVGAFAHTLAPRCIKTLQDQIGSLDKEYDKCNLIWAQGEVDKFGETLLISNNDCSGPTYSVFNLAASWQL